MQHERVYNLLINEDEITWQSILKDLIKSGEIDPWDIDISLLAQKYIQTIKTLQEMNLFVSGKVILASALLLRMKSDKLVNEDILALDNIMYPPPEDLLEDEFDVQNQQRLIDGNPVLTIKTPQTRKKRVTVDDLMNALEKALEVNRRRLGRIEERNRVPLDLFVPGRPIDITVLVRHFYDKIKNFFTFKDSLTFDELVDGANREDKIRAFIPLLNLDTSSDICLTQEVPFGEIDIKLVSNELQFKIASTERRE